jgi:hypothetical protein
MAPPALFDDSLGPLVLLFLLILQAGQNQLVFGERRDREPVIQFASHR